MDSQISFLIDGLNINNTGVVSSLPEKENKNDKKRHHSIHK